MNILPHKSWHVRTQKNIARVKKDQAKAAEEEKEKQRRIALAGQEARTSFLRERAGQRRTSQNLPRDVDDDNEESTDTDTNTGGPKNVNPVIPDPFALSADLTQSDGHINFFQEIEDGKRQESGVNADHEEEKKIEKEEYEKKIGLLVYLGQNSLEQSKDRPWYAQIERSNVKNKEVTTNTTTDKDLKILKLKDFQDPLKDIRSHLSAPGMKKKYGDLKGPSTSRKIEFAAASFSATTALTTKRKKSEDEDATPVKKKKHHKHKTRKHKHHKKQNKRSRSRSNSKGSDDSDDSGTYDKEEEKRKKLQQLRAERLEREREEKRKADKLLASLRGETYQEDLPKVDQTNISESGGHQPGSGRKQKYNSQFNPHLARQNYDN